MKLNNTLRICLIAAGAVAVAGGAVIAMEPELAKIHKKIEADYDNVEHIDGDEFGALDPDNTIVFDVRKVSEFEVSHLDGAIQVDPSIKPKDFIEQYGQAVEGKTVVFYCSVGRRSSNLAERVDAVLAEQGNTESYNLIGGVFQWHNEDRSLTNIEGSETNAIHPYNNHWGRLISDKSAIRYKPED